ncbi:hypothetical protein EDB85DRAFT_2028627 [Lactarius pseudohatsudake]|nr:hypothetical protein EDB85DRAFT_2028627 [Lactarius pseudohatsudake]
MGPSLTIPIPPHPTSSIPFTSSPSLVPPNPSSFLFPLHAVSQNIIMSGAPKPTQAEVSKIISAQWKAEPDEVRAIYDERAQIAKVEHARLYPNYRFTPMKRVDKDRMREEKRQAKEQERAGRRTRGRASPYALPPTASSSTPPIPLIAQTVLPNSKPASPLVSSASSPLPGTPSSQSSADIALRHGSTHAPSHDSYADPRRPNSSADDSQSASSRASSYSRADIPVATPLPAVPAHLQLSTPQTLTHKGWQPPQSESSSTTFLSPLQEFPLTEWPQSAPRSNEAPAPFENDNIFFSMPGFENEPLQHSSLLAELFGTDLPGVFQLQGIESPRLTARPPGSINLGVGNYLPGMCGSSAFDDALRSLGEDPTTFMANPTADELLATISMLSPQENDDLLSSGSAATDPLQGFNFDEYLQDFGGSAPPPPPAAGGSAPPGMHSVTVTLTVPHNSPVETSSSESLASPSPMPSFYATTPSPVSAVEPSPPPAAAQYQPWVPPSGAANAAGRRVGGSWKVPLAVSRLASESPIPSCASSLKQAAV